MNRLKKIPALVFLFFLTITRAWALDPGDFEKIEAPVGPHVFDVFSKVPLYYLEAPPGVRFAETSNGKSTVRFYLNPQAAEAARFQNEKSSRVTTLVKKIPMPAVLRAIYSQSKAHTGKNPELFITEGAADSEVWFYYLSDITTGLPYVLDVKGKPAIPAFVSSESAENIAKMITVATSKNLQVEKKDLAAFLEFVKLQGESAQRVRVFAYASRPEYLEIRPMTFGVFSSYLLGALLVLFLFWAITASAKRRP